MTEDFSFEQLGLYEKEEHKTRLATEYGQFHTRNCYQIFSSVLPESNLPYPRIKIDCPLSFIDPLYLSSGGETGYHPRLDLIYFRLPEKSVQQPSIEKILQEQVPFFYTLGSIKAIENDPLAKETGSRRVVDSLVIAHEYGHQFFSYHTGYSFPIKPKSIIGINTTPFIEFLNEGTGILFERVAGEVMKKNPDAYDLQEDDIQAIDSHFASRLLLGRHNRFGSYHIGFRYLMRTVYLSGIAHPRTDKTDGDNFQPIENVREGMEAVVNFLSQIDPYKASQLRFFGSKTDRAVCYQRERIGRWKYPRTPGQRNKHVKTILSEVGKDN